MAVLSGEALPSVMFFLVMLGFCKIRIKRGSKRHSGVPCPHSSCWPSRSSESPLEQGVEARQAFGVQGRQCGLEHRVSADRLSRRAPGIPRIQSQGPRSQNENQAMFYLPLNVASCGRLAHGTPVSLSSPCSLVTPGSGQSPSPPRPSKSLAP